jgi:hypothetical protein
MGKTRGPYKEEFPAGSRVQIVDVESLKEFARGWKLHHPLENSQLGFAGEIAEVEEVSFYHGGDELYRLRGLPGYWHEQCLTALVKS